jgi:hypothetical protein
MFGYHSPRANLKVKFPRDFKFPVTIPHTFFGELPEGLKNGVQQLEVHIVAQTKADEDTPGYAQNPGAVMQFPIIPPTAKLLRCGTVEQVFRACV